MTLNKGMTAYLAAFVNELTLAGIEDVVISPGSRSTPIAMIMAEHPHIKVWMQVDERSAGFFALGIAKAKKKPVPLVCTSGTAAANYFPAIVEASISRIPLLILTADRPHELRDVGAPQAINQIDLYGKYTKWFVEMALPEESDTMLNYIRMIANRAYSIAASGPEGPVHLNFPLRDPLIPDLTIPDLWDKGRTNRPRYVEVQEGKRQLDLEIIEHLANQLIEIEKGIIIYGPEEDPKLMKEVLHLAELLQYPILADPLSQLRSGIHNKEWILDSYDTFLRNEGVKQTMKPKVIIRFGAMPVSKTLMLYIKANPDTQQIIVDKDVGWREPTLQASQMIYADPSAFSQTLSKLISPKTEESQWAKKWKGLNQISKANIQEAGKMEELFEGKIIIELQELFPSNATLFVGNSMPIRDLDTFFKNDDKGIRIMANRGANGIDGIVSTALGASTISNPLVLLIGDLSFYHDLNGLLAAKLYQLNITIIVVNNNGGGIFSFLPQANHEKHFEALFGTPLGLDYEYVVKMYHGSFKRVTDWNEFRQGVSKSLSERGLSVIEVTTDRTMNAKLHHMLWRSAIDNISRNLEGEM